MMCSAQKEYRYSIALLAAASEAASAASAIRLMARGRGSRSGTAPLRLLLRAYYIHCLILY